MFSVAVSPCWTASALCPSPFPSLPPSPPSLPHPCSSLYSIHIRSRCHSLALIPHLQLFITCSMAMYIGAIVFRTCIQTANSYKGWRWECMALKKHTVSNQTANSMLESPNQLFPYSANPLSSHNQEIEVDS